MSYIHIYKAHTWYIKNFQGHKKMGWWDKEKFPRRRNSKGQNDTKMHFITNYQGNVNKITIKYHLIPKRLAFITTNKSHQCWCRCRCQNSLLVENLTEPTILEKSMTISQKKKLGMNFGITSHSPPENIF